MVAAAARKYANDMLLLHTFVTGDEDIEILLANALSEVPCGVDLGLKIDLESLDEQTYIDLFSEFKLKAVRFAEDYHNSNRKAAAKFGVDCKRIREWRQKKSKLEAASSTRKRLEGAGRKPFDEDIEESLLQWVHGRRSNTLRVARKMIANKAKFLYEEKCKKEMPPSFVASSGWLQRFMSRHGLAIRRKTTESQKDPEKLIDKLMGYILQIRWQRGKNHLPRQRYHCDGRDSGMARYGI
ncbi:Pogo transposable element with KRAB domain [Stylophora pistillata]|uniref:Pogo transposable element with KRAB domain n=1 Tax=Stylophora pistillata TaxID=50429 RepID=A0A2B4R8W5_STYPI|nr:Pogo transposable element with KRAB domain [Stylophora pistillata]